MAIDRLHAARWRRFVLGFTAIVGALAAGAGVGAQHRAQLSTDLLFHQSRRAAERTRVIVHGTRDEVTALARRHGVSVVRWLGDGAVLRVDGSQLSRLAADRVVDHLSGDPDGQVGDDGFGQGQGGGPGARRRRGLLGLGGTPA